MVYFHLLLVNKYRPKLHGCSENQERNFSCKFKKYPLRGPLWPLIMHLWTFRAPGTAAK